MWWPGWADAWPLLAVHALRGGKTARPPAIVYPGSPGDVARVLDAARRHRVCLVPRGGGSGVLGGAAPRRCCVVLDLSGLDWIRVYEDRGLVEAGAGVVLWRLEEELAGRGYTLAYAPQSVRVATVGGAIAALGSGYYQPGYGNIEDIVEYVDVATVWGETLRLGMPPRGRLGPGLKDLILGSEGTLAVVTGAGLRVRPRPVVASATYEMPSFQAGLDAARRLVQWNQPAVLRLLDSDEAQLLYGRGGPQLIVAYADDTPGIAERLLAKADAVAREQGGRRVEDLFTGWVRERLEYGRRVRELWGGGLWFDTVEVMAWWDRLDAVNRGVKQALAGETLAVFSHASHFYPTGGALYFTLVAEASPARIARAWRKLAETVEEAGAVPGHHHGIGTHRLGLIAGDCPAWYRLYCRVKNALDPESVLNPHALPAGCRRCTREEW